MIKFSLNAFIKTCLLDTGGRISEIQKRLNNSGGYDFYHSFQKAVRAHCGGQSEEVEEILEQPSNEVERRRNRSAFESFDLKFGSSRSLETIRQPKLMQFRSAGVAISVDPLFEISKSGVRSIYSAWATQKPPLSQRYGAVACYIMRNVYRNSGLANGNFYYSDLNTGRTYSEKQITNNTPLILQADVNSIGTLIKEL